MDLLQEFQANMFASLVWLGLVAGVVAFLSTLNTTSLAPYKTN